MKHRDDSIFTYNKKYPIVELSENCYDQSKQVLLLEKLKDSPWYKYGSDATKESALLKLKPVISLVGEIKSIIKKHYPNVKIKHLSIGGSYVFKNWKSDDIDFNVIVEGSFFDYVDIFEIDEINKKLFSSVKKISFMIFGEDDFLFNTGINDSIETLTYIHTSLCMREGVVFPIRNILVDGFDIRKKDVDKHNLVIRIKRQLQHAKLIVDGEVNANKDPQERFTKAVGRICEAAFYLSLTYPTLQINPRLVFEKEINILEKGDLITVNEWLRELDDLTNEICNNFEGCYCYSTSPHRLM